MIKSNSKNDTLNSPVSQDKKKTKQLTLFDLKSKSITINKENEKPTPVKLQNDKIITICVDERVWRIFVFQLEIFCIKIHFPSALDASC